MGLAVSNSTPHTGREELEDRKATHAKKWDSDEVWVVTHESSGLEVCAWPNFHEAAFALQVILSVTRIDWTRDMKTVRNEVMASASARECVGAMMNGRLIVRTQRPGMA